MAAVIQRRIRKMIDQGSFSSQVVLVPGGTTSAAQQFVDIVFVFDGATIGKQLDVRIDFNCIVTAWTLLLDAVATVRIDVWRDAFANYPPTVGDSMPGADADKPQTTAAASASDEVATWDEDSIAAGDVLRANIDTNGGASRATLCLKARRI